MRFHVNSAGNASVCNARAGHCPLGPQQDHYESLDAARRGYELQMQGTSFTRLKKRLKKTMGLPTEEQPTFKADGFAQFADVISRAQELNAPHQELSRAAFAVTMERIRTGEAPVIPQEFRAAYSYPSTIESSLTLKGWSPTNSTHEFIVNELAESIVAHHEQALENAGLKRDYFVETVGGLMGAPVEKVGVPDSAGDKITAYDEGWIKGYHDSLKEAMVTSFPSTTTREEALKVLKDFVGKRATLLEASWELSSEDEKDNFLEGQLDSHVLWLQEDHDWR